MILNPSGKHIYTHKLRFVTKPEWKAHSRHEYASYSGLEPHVFQFVLLIRIWSHVRLRIIMKPELTNKNKHEYKMRPNTNETAPETSNVLLNPGELYSSRFAKPPR
jgi:hypothetical protein